MMPFLPPPRPPFSIPPELAARDDLGWNAKAAWSVLWLNTGDDGLCHRRLRELAEQVGMIERTMRNALAELVRMELATPIRQPGKSTSWLCNNPSFRSEKIGEICRGTPEKSADLPEAEDWQNLPGSSDKDEEIWPSSEGTPAKSAGLARVGAHVRDARAGLGIIPIPRADPNSSAGEVQRGARASARLTLPFVPTAAMVREAKRIRPDVDPDFLTEKFTARFGPGGEEENATDPNWNRRWMAWVRAERRPEPVEPATRPVKEKPGDWAIELLRKGGGNVG